MTLLLVKLSGSPKLSQPAVNFCVVVPAEAVMTTVSVVNASESVLLMLILFCRPGYRMLVAASEFLLCDDP